MADIKKERKVKDFSKGMIYRIVCNITGDVYIGSSVQTCAQRLSKHVDHHKRWKKDNTKYTSSYIILARNDYKIILVESYPCKNNDELRAREQFWINQTECVNKIRAHNTPEQILLQHAEWKINNKEHIKTTNAEYYTNNKEKIKQVITCECGSEFQICEKSRHNKSQKHTTFISQSTPQQSPE